MAQKKPEAKYTAIQVYNAGYYNALKELRSLLSESKVPAIVALCGSIDTKLCNLRESGDLVEELVA